MEMVERVVLILVVVEVGQLILDVEILVQAALE